MKKVKEVLKVGGWKSVSKLYDRSGGVGNRERGMRINGNGGLKIREKKVMWEMEVVGRGWLKRCMVVEVLKVGKRWWGYWYIKKCSDRMDGGRGYISELELVRNNGRGGFEVGGGNINREDVVCNNGRSEGSSEVGKNKGGDGDCCDFRINGSKGEYEGLKGLDGNREEERKFVEDMVMYREENGNSGSKGNEGMIEVERSV